MKELKIKQIPDHISAVKKNGKFLHLQPNNTAGPLFLQEVTPAHIGSSCTVFKINNFEYADNKLTLNALISFPETCKRISIQANLLDEDTERVICSLDEMTVENSTDLAYVYDGKPITANIECERAAVILYADWIDSGEDEGEAALFGDEQDIDFKYEHKYPKKEKNGYVTFGDVVWPSAAKIAEERREIEGREESENIVIALVRTPTDAHDLDYLCQFGHREWKGNVDYPPASVPAHGKLTRASDGVQFLNDDDSPIKAVCSISPPGVGGALIAAVGSSGGSYQTGNIKFKMPDDKSSLTYDMTDAWDVTFFESGEFDLHEFDYEFTITFYASVQEKKQDTPYTFCVTSHDPPPDNCLKQIPRITIKWGCLAEGTEVLMANGRKKAIEDIQIGEHVRTDGGTAEVTNMWRGEEKECLLIRADNRHKLIVTKDHPVLTLDGWKQAGALTCLDVLKTRTGSSAIRKIERITKTVTVYNPETGGKIIYANGFAAGDFTLQNSRLGKE